MRKYFSKKLKRLSILKVAFIFIIVGIITGGFYITIYQEHICVSECVSLDKVSKMGDFIGGIVSVASALVGVFLLYETLRLQRIELKKSRKMFKYQQFENSFFQLLSLHNEIVSGIDISKSEMEDSPLLHTGRDCFEFFYKEFKGMIPKSDIKNLEIAKKKYKDFYYKREADLGHYFRNMFHILNYVKFSPINSEQKKRYSDILRSTLSLNELRLLYYNHQANFCNEEFKNLIREYNFLKSLSKYNLISSFHADQGDIGLREQ